MIMFLILGESSAATFLQNMVISIHLFLDEPLETIGEEEDEEKQKYEGLVHQFDRNWATLQSTMRNLNNLEPLLIYCKHSEEEAFAIATKKIECK